MKKNKILVVIPARAGSKRIPRKNIRKFLGKPLIGYTIEQALAWKRADRIVVDTESEEFARCAQSYGAEVPFLRPKRLARDASLYYDSLTHLLGRLKEEEGYTPTHVVLLQTVSPLRILEDIEACWKMMRTTDATTVLTLKPTHPRLYHIDKDHNTILVNGTEAQSTNVQEWAPGYTMNGSMVYVIDVKAFIEEGVIMTKKTKAVVSPKWRSVDLDDIDDWVVAEILYKNKKSLEKRLKNFT